MFVDDFKYRFSPVPGGPGGRDGAGIGREEERRKGLKVEVEVWDQAERLLTLVERTTDGETGEDDLR